MNDPRSLRRPGSRDYVREAAERAARRDEAIEVAKIAAVMYAADSGEFRLDADESVSLALYLISESERQLAKRDAP